MKKRIAVPTENGILCSHFGHCESFYIADVENNEIVSSNFVKPPKHEPGVYPAWVKEQGVSEVICGGIGERAQALFAQQNIKLHIGAKNKNVEDLIRDLISGKLETGQNICDH